VPLYKLLGKISENVLTQDELQDVVSCVDAVCAKDMLDTIVNAAPRSKTVAPLVALASTAKDDEKDDAVVQKRIDFEKLSAILYLISVLAQRTEYIASSIRPNDQLMRTAILQLFSRLCVDIDNNASSMSVDIDVLLDIARSITSFFVTIVKDGRSTLFVLPDKSEEEEDDDEGDTHASPSDISIVELVNFTYYTLSNFIDSQDEMKSSASSGHVECLKDLCVNGLTLINAHAHSWKVQKPLSELFWSILDRRFGNILSKAEAFAPLNSKFGGLVQSIIVLMSENKKRPRLS